MGITPAQRQVVGGSRPDDEPPCSKLQGIIKFNPVLRGWINYYGGFYKSALYPTLQHFDRILARWATRKYKRLKGHKRNAADWLRRIARRQPMLFAHWQLL